MNTAKGVYVLSEHHYLTTDLSGYKEKIHQLKLDDTHFSSLYSEYVEVDKAIYRIEKGYGAASDECIAILKNQQAMLKGELCDMLIRLERSRVN